MNTFDISHKRWRWLILSKAMKDKKKDCAAKLSKKLKYPVQLNGHCSFSDEKYSAGSDDKFKEQQLIYSVPTWFNDIDQN